MSEVNQEQGIDYLSNLTVIQIKELTDQLEDKWGVSAAAAVPSTSTPGSSVVASAPASRSREAWASSSLPLVVSLALWQ